MMNLRVFFLLLLALIAPVYGYTNAKVDCEDGRYNVLTCYLRTSHNLQRTKQWRQFNNNQVYTENLPEVKEMYTEFKMRMYEFDNNTFIGCRIGSDFSENYKIIVPNRLTNERYPVRNTTYYSNEKITFKCNQNAVVGWIYPTKSFEIKTNPFVGTLNEIQTNSVLCCISYIIHSPVGYTVTVERVVSNFTKLVYKKPGIVFPPTTTRATPKRTQTATEPSKSKITTTQATTKAKTTVKKTTQTATKPTPPAITQTQTATKPTVPAITTTQTVTKATLPAIPTTQTVTKATRPAITKTQAATTVKTIETTTMPTSMATTNDTTKYYIIPVAVVGTIILISLIYVIIKKFYRKPSGAEETLELETYASAGNVLYADLAIRPSGGELPPNTDDSPYAEIVGVFRPESKTIVRL